MSIDFDRIRQELPPLQVIIGYSGIKLHKQGSRWFAHCPFHDDSTPSFSIFADGKRCGCPPCQWDGDVFEFVQRFQGLPDAVAAARWLCDEYGVEVFETVAPRAVNGRRAAVSRTHTAVESKRKTRRGREIEHYDYTDPFWVPEFRVFRYERLWDDTGEIAPGKDFSQRRILPDGSLARGMDGVTYWLYRAPAVAAATQVWLCEGERDVHAMEARGVVATTDAGGCGAVRQFAERGYPAMLAGKDVLIVPDTDKVGRERGAVIAHALHGVSARVRIVPIPEPYKDVRDYIEAGGTMETLMESAVDYTPPAADSVGADNEAFLESLSSVSDPAIPDLRYFAQTDYGNAERLHAVFGDRIRWCHDMQRWLVWNDKRWVVDHQHAIIRLARQTMRHFLAQVPQMDSDLQDAADKFGKKSENKAGLHNMVDLCRSLHGVSISAADLDADPWLLNVQNGILDLRTGEVSPHAPEFLISKICPVRFNIDAECPLFLRFLRRILDDRDNLIDYVQRAIGYSLSGIVSEKAMFCAFGQGNNGKTTLLELFRWILGDYSAQVMIDTLMAKASENNNTLADLADIRGARFVTTSEAEENARLSEGKIKYLTGMGEVKTCRKYENPIVFAPSHKIWMDANHRPVVRGTDKAIWNRLKPIGFTVTIPDAEIDRDLQNKLRAEAEGILTWAVWGCRDWQADGLGDLPEIAEESDRWKAENDPLKDFLEDWCRIDLEDSECFTRASELRKAYEKWAEEEGERFELSRHKFKERLELRGLKYAIRRWKYADEWRSERVWHGIALRRSG